MRNRLWARVSDATARGIVFTLFLSSGCTSVNGRLNNEHLALEARARNATRAATFAVLRPAQATTTRPDASDESSTPLVRPTTGIAPPTDQDGYFVGIALSGGGSRSANFSAATLFQLQRIGLLQHADYLSSVSGGSLTAAYYCVSGEEWNPGNVQRKLSYSFASDMIWQTFMPWNLLAMGVSNYDRSDLLADSFRRNLFTRKGKALTYANLRPDRPRLLINATDLQSGRRFVFCNESFDEINSDLSKYPLHYAVTASASFPLVLHQVTLRDYSTIFKQYRHLIDGGVTDNLGIQTLVETYEAQQAAARASGRPEPYPNGAVVVVIDARTHFDARLSNQGDIGFVESLKAGAGLTATALLTRAGSASFAEIIVQHSPPDVTAQTIRQQIRQLERSGFLELKDSTGHRVHVIHFSLGHANRLSALPFQSFSESLNSIATYFNISQTEVYNLYTAAELLMRERFEPRLRQIVDELNATRQEPSRRTEP